MSVRNLSLTLAFALVTAPLFAAGKPGTNLQTVIKKVQEQQRKTNTLQAEFRQEKELALMATPEVSTGTFVFSKPNNVRWSYSAPNRVEMVIANGALTTWYPDLNKAEKLDVKRFEDRIFKYMGATGAIDELAKYFDFTFTDTPSNPVYALDLKPKTKSIEKRVKRIRIWIDKQTFITSKIEYTEGDGDVTRYEFRNVKINQPLDAARFTLKLPATTKVEQMKLQ
jgi:outer membrane lipoprotein-sorting protein